MKKYSVVQYIYGEYGEMELVRTFETDNPKTAIKKWCQYELKAPTMACITAKREDAEALLTYANDHIEEMKELFSKPKFPYKLQYMIDNIEKKSLSGFSNNYPDQIYPFALG